MFRVVGNTRAAVRLTVDNGAKATVNSPVLTVNSPSLDLKQAIVSGPADLTISTGPNPVVFDPSNWIVNRQYVAAQAESQHILAAQGGIFRVDVPAGDRFVLTPSQLVAYQGVCPLDVYEQGRLDVLNAWAGYLRDGLRKIYLASAGAARFVFRKGSELLNKPTGGPLGTEENSAPSWYSKDPAYTVYWHRVKTSSRGAWGSFKEWLFYATHPRKLQFEGPCSVLIRGTI